MQPGLRATSLRGEAEFSRAGAGMEGPYSGKNEKVSAECQKHMGLVVCPSLDSQSSGGVSVSGFPVVWWCVRVWTPGCLRLY